MKFWAAMLSLLSMGLISFYMFFTAGNIRWLYVGAACGIGASTLGIVSLIPRRKHG